MSSRTFLIPGESTSAEMRQAADRDQAQKVKVWCDGNECAACGLVHLLCGMYCWHHLQDELTINTNIGQWGWKATHVGVGRSWPSSLHPPPGHWHTPRSPKQLPTPLQLLGHGRCCESSCSNGLEGNSGSAVLDRNGPSKVCSSCCAAADVDWVDGDALTGCCLFPCKDIFTICSAAPTMCEPFCRTLSW